ncbi:hypothetical protein SSX86_028760 [Deinandra increscens subsp. villosa]|uniref:RRM domain-containing protein n=1 Tax=Deinandra increscens subsp. villosa TaxID=3103831 RepID=A0AAP0CEJ8_9ASTR
MSRKREKPSFSRHTPHTFPKRRRPLPADPPLDDNYFPDKPSSSSSGHTTAAVVITGLSSGCSVLDLKSRFEIYGPISRTRMDPGGVAYITFRSRDSAESAISASIDPSFGITLNSTRVQVTWASDPVPQWREGVNKGSSSSSSSKLLKPEVPLSRHGRGSKLGSAIGRSRDEKSVASKGREMVAYDDIL